MRSILKLSESQRGALKQAIDRRDAERKAGKVRPDDEKALGKEAMAILTPEQRERLLGLLGRPCAFQTNAVIRTAGERRSDPAIRR